MQPMWPRVSSSWQRHVQAARAEQDSGLLDALALVVIAVGLLRFWAVLSAADVAFLLAMAAASAVLLAWRRAVPGSARSFARHRELPAVVLRVAIAASPTAWKVTRQTLGGVPPYSSGSGGWNLAVFALSLGFCSFAATANVLALARPVRLALHAPTQALVMLCIWWHNAAICESPALQHPAAQQATAATYSALTALVRLGNPLTLPPALARHGPAGQCSAVLALAELLLGFLAPTLLLAASEAELYQRWKRAWLKWQKQQLGESSGSGGSGGGGDNAGGSSSSQMPAAAAGPQVEPPNQPPSQLHSDLFPCLRPPSKGAACLYDLLSRHPFTEPNDVVIAALTALLLLGAAWQAILAVTPM
ncbi:hypothetical protein C2E21_5660 [Chlorella sorokiniana]|uniref:Uncharacterized protein n=1 Tax=Chlorella sorokiniana TaxID=3076 RepID=A0A2P6TNH4_CHLSO|nr:hypothetical protein C2E21_5660 [Chlorella sorokiniana]|eukprot:PRW50887.1 hypothetical protein C2E21_5660 [Chlorella sorokiniana]